MRLLLLTVAFGLLQSVRSDIKCKDALPCEADFVTGATKAASDQEAYCIVVRQKIDCLRNIQNQCPPEQKQWVENDIRTTLNANEACGAVAPVSMTITAMTFLSLVIYIFSRQ